MPKKVTTLKPRATPVYRYTEEKRKFAKVYARYVAEKGQTNVLVILAEEGVGVSWFYRRLKKMKEQWGDSDYPEIAEADTESAPSQPQKQPRKQLRVKDSTRKRRKLVV